MKIQKKEQTFIKKSVKINTLIFMKQNTKMPSEIIPFMQLSQIPIVHFEDEPALARLVEIGLQKQQLSPTHKFLGDKKENLRELGILADHHNGKTLLITDNKMPILSGIEVVRFAITHNIPTENIFLCSNSVSQGDSIHLRPEFSELGVTKIFGKDWEEIAELAKAVKQRHDALTSEL